MTYVGGRVEMLDGSMQGTITSIPNPTFWNIKWDDGEEGAVHPLDVKFLGKGAKFKVGEQVQVTCILDEMTSKDLVGFVGTIREVDPLANGAYNYDVDGHYMHEEELQPFIPPDDDSLPTAGVKGN